MTRHKVTTEELSIIDTRIRGARVLCPHLTRHPNDDYDSATMTSPTNLIANFPSDVANRIRSLRQHLHANPELAFQEEQTCSRLQQEMSQLEPRSVTRVAGTGIVARIPGRDPAAPLIAIRGDIDALPIPEDTGLKFSSVNPGVMHACGHDVHAAWAAGAAHLLRAKPAAGDVLIIFQPAEEIGAGATAILEAGVLDDVQAIFGGHVDRRFAVGEVVADTGPLAAAADSYTITIKGAGAHGARPHEARDPIVGAAAVVQALQTIVARRLNPATAAVVTVGTIQAGTASNVIPEDATLSGTLRAVESKTREALHRAVAEIANGVASAYGLSASVSIDHGTPPIVNEARATGWARKAVSTTLGASALKPLGILNMGGEDFAFYMESIPGCFMRIGAREEGGEVIPAHTPRFYAAEDSVLIGAAVLAETARVAAEAIREERSAS